MTVSFSAFFTWATMALMARQTPPSFPGPAPAPAMASDFPDPSIVQDVDGAWYAFATEHAGVHVQAARASAPTGPWTRIDGVDLLPESGAFFTGNNTWAPDVRVLGPNRYVLYFSGEVAGNASHHCVGVATAERIIGPYKPAADDEAFACDLAKGGDIDPSGFVDVDGALYVAYKVDGNSVGRGGQCGNGIDPKQPTPIMLQKMAANGVDKAGDARRILDIAGSEPLVEAPALWRSPNGTYVLFFSSGCYTDPSYNVDYATAPNVTGPYTRARRPLITTNDSMGLVSPGGATPVQGGDVLVFHANCPEGRCMHVNKFVFADDQVTLL